jgi:hypothetical protein
LAYYLSSKRIRNGNRSNLHLAEGESVLNPDEPPASPCLAVTGNPPPHRPAPHLESAPAGGFSGYCKLLEKYLLVGGRIMDDISKETWLEGIFRLAKETKSPLSRMLLKKFGLSLLDIRIIGGKVPIEVVINLWNDSSLLSEDYWRVPIQAVPIKTICTSDNNPAVTSVTIFAEIPSYWSNLFQFLDSPSTQKCYWFHDFYEKGESKSFELPVLKRGFVLSLGFSEINRIGPKPDDIGVLLRRANDEREAVNAALLAQKMLKHMGTSESSSSSIAKNLASFSTLVIEVITNLTISVVITLDDSTLLPFKWDYARHEYVKGFFTGGLTAP